MKALVTGGTGFVGAAVVRALLREGAAVRCLVRRRSPMENLHGLPVEVLPGDLLEADSLRPAAAGCAWVFHVAAHYSLWSRDSRTLYRVNVEGTKNMLEACSRAAGCERIVYTSTVGCLGWKGDGLPADEETPASLGELVGDYKKSKFLAEAVARDFARKGLPIVIVNPSAPIGPGDVKPTPTGKLVVDFLKRKIPGYVDTGLNIVDVDDVGLGHVLAAKKGRIGERYILGNENLTLKQILDLLAEITGLPPASLRVPHFAALLAAVASEALSYVTGRPPDIPLWGARMARKKMFFDPSKARRELGFPATAAREALRRAARWFVDHNYAPCPPLFQRPMSEED